VPDYVRFLRTGDNVIGIWTTSHADRWRLDSVVRVTHAVDELAAPGERVIALWPGYLVQSHAAPFPGLENNSATYFSGRLTSEQMVKYHIAGERAVEAALAAHDPRLFVLGNEDSMLVRAAPYEALLARHGYERVRTVGGATIWSPSR
jgi:hypothetical protein